MREDELLKCVYLILQGHQVGYRFIAILCKLRKTKDWNGIPFIRIIDGFQTDVFLIFEGP
jgi:hypothetical protein